jgi:ABC-2 type transport system ATP-binding protein
MEPALSVQGVHKRFGSTTALDGVDLEVRAGEVFGLLGPNGAGKSTLIRIVMDVLRADSGRILLDGRAVARAKLDRVGYLPEERGLYRKQKVLEVLVYLGLLKGLSRREARARATDWLRRMQLEHTARWQVERLSKGMSQKVQIASTLLCEPEMCVLDEPFSGLDPVNLRLVRDLIRARSDAGRTTILSTHQMNEVEGLCDRIALIHRGKVLVYGTVGEVRRAHSLPQIAVELASGEPPELSGVSASRRGDGTWLLALEAPRDPADVLGDLIAGGARVERFEPVLTSLEEIFVRVVSSADTNESDSPARSLE